MSHPDDGLRERLLGQHVPEPEKLATYRRETQVMLDREERSLRLYGRFTAAMWVVLVVMGTGYALVAGWARDQPTTVYFSIGLTVLLLLIGGAVQLVSGFIARARLELARDIKGVELRLIELEGLVRDRNHS
jgi:hypothetical protein